MNIFLSRAAKDRNLAELLTKSLRTGGFSVFDSDTDIDPGENWAKRIGLALQNSDFIVFLLTPSALESEWVRKDVEFALGSKKHDGRVYSVFVGPKVKNAKNLPWILLKLPHRQVESPDEFSEVAADLDALSAAAK